MVEQVFLFDTKEVHLGHLALLIAAVTCSLSVYPGSFAFHRLYCRTLIFDSPLRKETLLTRKPIYVIMFLRNVGFLTFYFVRKKIPDNRPISVY